MLTSFNVLFLFFITVVGQTSHEMLIMNNFIPTLTQPPTVAKPPAVKDLSEKRQVRQTMVIQRRTTLLESVQESLQEKGQRLAEKQQKVQDTLQEHSLHVAQLRATRLLLIISTINSLNTMYNVVNEARKLKAQSPTR